MSERDLKRMEVLTEVLAGRRTVASAAVLALGVRQLHILVIRYREDGGGVPIHKHQPLVRILNYVSSFTVALTIIKRT